MLNRNVEAGAIVRHPWGGSLKKRNPRSWSRQARSSVTADLDESEKRSREPSMRSRDDAPVCVALCGHDPERVEQLRAGYFPDWAR